MSPLQLRVEERRFLRARSGGLAERTAFVDIAVQGVLTRDDNADRRIRSGASALRPGEPFYGVGEADWPTAFLVPGDSRSPDLDALSGWLGEWVVALTVAIQRWGRDPVLRGRVLEATQDRLRLAIPWFRPDFFDEALALALRLIPGWLGPPTADAGSAWRRWLGNTGTPADEDLEWHFGGRWDDIQRNGLGPNTLRFIEAAVRRGMPFDVLPGFVQIGWGANAQRFDLAYTGQTGVIAATLAKNKFKTYSTLSQEGVPVPQAWLVSDLEQAKAVADDLGWPVVLKPLDLEGGSGVATGIRDSDRLRRSFEHANRLSPGRVLVERHVEGDDYRLLVVHGRVVHAVRRTPAGVVGNGVNTVRELADQVNSDPRRGTGRYSPLKTLLFDADVLDCLAEQGLDTDSVPPRGLTVRLGRIPNISTGGTAEDVTDDVHPDNLALAARAARIVGLDIAGVDYVSPDISRPWREVDGVICEVNGQPGFRPHWLADPQRDINGEILDLLFAGRPARVPTAAISGTNGKSTTSEMLYRIWTAAGKVTGVCTTAVVRIGDQIISTDNLSGQPGSAVILNDPAVEAAVLEMPRKGLIIFGHHCDRYEVAALLNVQDDHIGIEGVATLEQMAELKAEVLQRATKAIVVNAEDPLCIAMRSRAGTDRHILVSRTRELAAVAEHRRHGGEAVFLDDRDGRTWIILAAGSTETALMPTHDIPATMNGLLTFNESNAMFAAALAWAQGVDTGIIRRALGAFHNSPEQNPGRYNFVADLPFEVLIDFAHNPDGVRGVCAVASALPVAGRRILCSVNVGSRHPSHVTAAAPMLAGCFDEFVLGCDPKLVGSCPDYAGDRPADTMVARSRGLLLDQGVDADRITTETDPREAVRTSLGLARSGDLLVLLVDYDTARPVIEQWRTRQAQH